MRETYLFKNNMSAKTADSNKGAAKKIRTVLAPELLPGCGGDFEVSIHLPPKALEYELDMIFPSVDVKKDQVVCILTAQKSKMKLLNWNDETALEKDLLLERFVKWASSVREFLTGMGPEGGEGNVKYWADWIDPCSGLPANGDGNKVYGEVDGFELMCNYKTNNAGGCKILLHPSWESAVYPATVFTNAPADVTVSVIRKFLPEMR